MNYQKDSEPAGEQMTLFSQAGSLSLVNHTQHQENERAKTMTATSGRRCLEQFGKFNQAGLWAKTFAASLIGMEGWYSTKCKLIWKLKATKCSRFYFQLQALTHRIEEIGYGLLPTPLVMDTNEQTDLEKIDARRARLKERNNGKNGTKKTGNGFGQTLGGLMQKGLLPTPDASLATGGKVTNPEKVSITGKTTDGKKRQISLNDYVRRGMLPTPQSAEGYKLSGKENQDSLVKRIGNSSQLNPLFVTEMMGFPVDWLTLPFQSGGEKV